MIVKGDQIRVQTIHLQFSEKLITSSIKQNEGLPFFDFRDLIYLKSTPIFPILNFAHILVQLGMKTQTRSISRDGGAVYREFSRKRYKELKARSPNLRESEIVQKIIQEWDGLSMEEKSRLRVSGELDNAAATPVKRSMKLAKPDKANLKTTGAKTFPDEPDRSQKASDSANVQQIESSSKVLFPSVTKGIKKAGKTQDYMTFFKFYFDRTMKDHPNWTSNQATIIIKLMWKKRLLTKTRKTRNIKPRTGRQAFGEAQRKRGFSQVQILKRWKHLPVESRMLWRHAGNPLVKKAEPRNVCSTMKLSTRSAQESRRNDDKMVPEEMESNKSQFDFLKRK